MTLTAKDYKSIVVIVAATVLATIISDKIRKEMQKPYQYR